VEGHDRPVGVGTSEICRRVAVTRRATNSGGWGGHSATRSPSLSQLIRGAHVASVPVHVA